MEGRRQRSFSANGAALAECLAWLEEELKAVLPAPQIPRVLLVAEEALANIVDYAYPADWPGQKIMTVGLEIQEEQIRLVIEDEGIPFDPLVGIAANANLPLEERGLGGWGRVFIEKFTARRAYAYQDGKNILQLYFDRTVS